MVKKIKKTGIHIVLLFLISRMVLFLSLPTSSLHGYGDLWNFYRQVQIGLPFIDYWTEFPPLFPFLSALVNAIGGGKQHVFDILLAGIFTLFQAGSIYYFICINRTIKSDGSFQIANYAYFTIISALFYGWTYFDPIAVFFMIFSIHQLINKRHALASLGLALGGLTKWFPLLLLPAVWKWEKNYPALKMILGILVIVTMVWGGLFLISPEMTKASLISQGKKGSWETVWALVDGNLRTGNFSPTIDRKIPATAKVPSGKPAVIPPWLTLIVFAGIGFWIFIKTNLEDEKQLISFIGITMVLFFLWSPGYSPQWVLYLLPIILLMLPTARGVLLSTTIVLVHLLEWPVLLSRGYFWGLYFLIPVRVALLVLLGWNLWHGIGTNFQMLSLPRERKPY